MNQSVNLWQPLHCFELHSNGHYDIIMVIVTVEVKSKFISIARLKTTELHQSAVQQIQYNKNSLYKKKNLSQVGNRALSGHYSKARENK